MTSHRKGRARSLGRCTTTKRRASLIVFESTYTCSLRGNTVLSAHVRYPQIYTNEALSIFSYSRQTNQLFFAEKLHNAFTVVQQQVSCLDFLEHRELRQKRNWKGCITSVFLKLLLKHVTVLFCRTRTQKKHCIAKFGGQQEAKPYETFMWFSTALQEKRDKGENTFQDASVSLHKQTTKTTCADC